MKNTIHTLLLISFTFLVSCDKGFEALNKAPDKPVVADIRAVYNGISSHFRNVGTEQTFFRNELLWPSTQLVGLSRKIGVNPIQRTNLWNGYYTNLANIVWLESKLDKVKNFNTTNARAMVKIVKAFTTLKTTDIYGDMPYREAGKAFLSGSDQVIRPVYDNSKSIYSACLKDLKWAADHIVEQPDATYLSFVDTDTYYKGDMLKWKKLANTLRLRYALRISEKESGLAAEIIAEILNANKPLIEGVNSTTEDFVFNRIDAGDRGYLQYAFRAAGSCGVRMGETIWHFMSDNDAQDGSGIFDPRLYVFFEPNTKDRWIAVAQDFDSVTPADDSDIYASPTDKPDDNHYSPINRNFVFSKTNRVPIVTSCETYFLKAEAYARGIGVSKDMAKAEENYYNGIKASVNYWYDVIDNDLEQWNYPIKINRPPTAKEMKHFLDHPKVVFTGTDEEKLDKIYQQRWASLFWLPEEAHFLQSRTAKTPLTGSRGDFYRLPYPESEEANNKKNYDAAISKMGGNSFDIKLWWMK